MQGLPYMTFLVPGLILMAMITNAFSNVASSFFGAKFMRNIEEVLVAPVSPTVLLAGFCTGGVVRAALVGAVIYVVSIIFEASVITHLWAVLFFGLITAVIFSLFGFLNGLYAKKFDDVGLIPTFVLTPLTYLGGVFYEIDRLPTAWQAITKLNPLVYMIDGFRYGFTGEAQTPVIFSGFILLTIAVISTTLAWHLLRRGIGIKN